jgi:hypothetical protein
MDVESLTGVTTANPSGRNLGELLRSGTVLTTREVLAIVHEACRDPTPTFPSTPDDLWITDTGELLIARSDQVPPAIDPRSGAASLLEAMLPPEGAENSDRIVPPALRGLPKRLRGAKDDVRPQDRKDLMAVLLWHLGGDPREVIQNLAVRVSGKKADVVTEAAPATAPAPAAASMTKVAPPPAPSIDLDLFPTSSQPAVVVNGPRTKSGKHRAGTVVAVAVLLIAIGTASYWLIRDDADDVNGTRAGDVVVPVEATPPAVPPGPTRGRVIVATPAIVKAGPPQPLDLEVADGAFSPTFATTGRELFFHAGRANAGRLLVANLDDSGHVMRVSAVNGDHDEARNYHPRVSPDGRWIAFDSDRDGDRGVYVASRDGEQLQRVSGPGYAAVPSWSPDMKWLAFIRGEPSRPRVWNLWLRDLSTGALQRHTAFRSGQVWAASWFPDGRSICYSHDEQLIISHVDGREDTVIESPRRGRLVRTPAVSPDGRRVVFQVFRDGVWLLDVHTLSMRRILDDATAEEFAWSPDGRRIVYHSRRGGDWRIWVMAVQ